MLGLDHITLVLDQITLGLNHLNSIRTLFGIKHYSHIASSALDQIKLGLDQSSLDQSTSCLMCGKVCMSCAERCALG